MKILVDFVGGLCYNKFGKFFSGGRIPGNLSEPKLQSYFCVS